MEEEKDKVSEGAPPQEGEYKPSLLRVFIVGLGQTGRELFCRLMGKIEVTGVDIDEKKLEMARRRPLSDNARLECRDGTSRLTWQDLSLSENDTVITVVRRDDVNLEVSRVVKEHFGVKRIFSLIHSSSMKDEYGSRGVETVDRAEVLASFFESRVLLDRRPAMNIGLGKGELLEVPIMQGSPVIGRRLSSFHARPWLVGAIYREGKLIVPHGHTVLKQDDKVVLIGEPHVLSGIADFFRTGEPEFPLQFGTRIGVLVTSSLSDESYNLLLSEANYLAANTKAHSMVLLSLPGSQEPDVELAERVCGGTGLTCEPAYFPEDDESWPRKLQVQDFGAIITGWKKMGLLQRVGLRRSMLVRILREADYPVIISRGTHPYKKILIPVVRSGHPLRVAELGINLSRLFNAELHAITVTEPAFSAGAEEVSEQKQVLDQVLEHSALYHKSIRVFHLEGNPIKEVVKHSKDYDLVVMGYRKTGTRVFLFDMAVEILRQLQCSVVVVPYEERPS
ncbi:MAG: universal stress protein [bacterium]